MGSGSRWCSGWCRYVVSEARRVAWPPYLRPCRSAVPSPRRGDRLVVAWRGIPDWVSDRRVMSPAAPSAFACRRNHLPRMSGRGHLGVNPLPFRLPAERETTPWCQFVSLALTAAREKARRAVRSTGLSSAASWSTSTGACRSSGRASPTTSWRYRSHRSRRRWLRSPESKAAAIAAVSPGYSP